MNEASATLTPARLGAVGGRSRLFVAGLFFCVWAVQFQAQAQDQEPVVKIPPPPPPYLNAAPDYEAWVVHFDPQADGANSKQRFLKEIHATKAGDIRRETSVWSDGTTVDTWYEKGVKLVLNNQNPAKPYAVAVDPFGGSEGPTPAQMDFFELSWVGQKTFAGKTKKSEHACYYYRMVDSFSGLSEAWIDSASGLPIAFQNALGLGTFEFTPGPPTQLTVPAIFQQAYDQHAKEMQTMRNYLKDMPR